MDLYVPLFLIIPFLFNKKSITSNSGTNSVISEYNFLNVEKIKNVSFAMGTTKPKWPLITQNIRGKEVPYLKTNGKYVGNASRSFGATREDGERHHVGIDLYCNLNDIVVACESGTIVGIQGFLGPTKALVIQGNSGLVILYGEIKDESWKEFNLKKGSIVKKGEPIARIGSNQWGTYMLHFETYSKGTTKNSSWPVNTIPNSSIRNPTKYLLQAQKYDLT